MPNPIPALVEAFGAHLDGWQPDDFKELLAFLDGLPELAEKIHETMSGVFTDLAADRRISEPVTDASDEMLVCLRNAQDIAPDVAEAFREESKFWLGDGD